MSDLRVYAKQDSPSQANEDTWVAWRGTRTGIPFVASWREALLLEGRCFFIDVGSFADAADPVLIQGGGAGSFCDLDQPEFGVSVPAGTTLIPLEINVSCSVDLDANDEVAHILVIADTAAAYAGDGTVTSETPLNLLDASGVTTVATAFSAATANITDPTVSRILASKTIREMAVTDTTAGAPVFNDLHYKPDPPPCLTGPCAIYGFWGGTTRVDATAQVVWAEVPTTRFTIA